ncbi:MAG TPA: DUF2889 domain-containing protein [Deltaproteobacteria bacterium]|nr:DUF2889 domain-containing protein [Deltaproteobacteria bacterium]HQJ09596.1 DUF2889 domain-containing protein [Deltaproteobacteria bacterium]
MTECTASCGSQAVHSRSIGITTHSRGEDSIVVEGTLKDERLVDTYSVATGGKMEPGPIHDLAIRLFIKGPGLLIEDVEVDINHVPRDECHRTKESLRPLIGRSIAPGFTVWVKVNLGGPRGCTHLNSLLLAMAPAALQGFWSSRTSRPVDMRQASKGLAREYLIDTCWVWRSDGPLARELTSSLQKDGRGE